MSDTPEERTGRALGADIVLLARGEAPVPCDDPEYRELLAVAERLLREEVRPLQEARPGYREALEARLLAQLPANTLPRWRRYAAVAVGLGLVRFPAPRLVIGGLTILLVLAVVAGTAVAASSRIRVYRPETPGNEPPLLAPLLPPAAAIAYQRADPATVARASGRAIAYLPGAPIGADTVTEVALLPIGPALSDDVLSLRTHALVRYSGAAHTVLVVLDEPSSALAQRRDLVLGDRTVRLADGREAWAATRPNWAQSNTVALASEGYIVIVASDLPSDAVAALAAQVVIAPQGAGAGETPPAALPVGMSGSAPAAPNGADLAITGSVRREGWGNRPQLVYQLALGNRGAGDAQEVRVEIVPSPALAARVHDLPASALFDRQGPGQLSGLGGSITFDITGMADADARTALAAGLTVRVTWREDGVTQERTFLIR